MGMTNRRQHADRKLRSEPEMNSKIKKEVAAFVYLYKRIFPKLYVIRASKPF